MPETSIYDRVAFPSRAFPASHPDRLAALATARGIQPPAVSRSRILEIGCGAAGNLLPLAAALPHAECWGIDLSESQIAEGRELAQQAELANVRLECLDVRQLDESYGNFDYVICHGVFSWVAPDVQDQILSTCHTRLSPSGLAYINYNVFPGWHLQGLLRDALQWKARHETDPESRLRRGRELIQFLLANGPTEKTPYGAWLRSELLALQRLSDPFLFHAYLNMVNRPLYFHEFLARATAVGLRYVGDSDTSISWLGAGNADADPAHAVEQLSSETEEQEQLFDFVSNRVSRHSVMGHGAMNDGEPRWLVEGGWYAAHIQEEHPKQAQAGSRIFRSRNNKAVGTTNPALAAVLDLLQRRWPGAISWDELLQVTEIDGQGDRSWHEDLQRCLQAGLLEMTIEPPRCVAQVSVRPRATPLARIQARGEGSVTNLRHQNVHLPAFERAVLEQLDGQQGLTEIVKSLQTSILPGQPVSEGNVLAALQRLCTESLLTA